MWVWNWVAHIKGVWEYGVQKNMWALEGQGDKGVEKTT